MCEAPRWGLEEPSLYTAAHVGAPIATSYVRAPVLACLPGMPAYTGLSSASPQVATSASASSADARRALASLEAHRSAGRMQDALIALATLRALVPELADRWDSIEGELRPADRRGCDAFSRAIESPSSAIAARARVGHVRCLIAIGDRTAPRQLTALLARYPELPEAIELRLLEAASREERGDIRGAIAIYRDIDLVSADAPAAVGARDALARLGEEGHRVPPLTSLQLVERADRIVRYGPPDLARAEIDRLLEMRMPTRERSEITLLAARIARVEGRFADAEALTRQAHGGRPGVADDASAVPITEADLEASAVALAQQEARDELRRLVGRSRTLRRMPTARLFAYLRTAASAGLREELDLALDDVSARSLPCGLRLDAGVLGSGTGDDTRVARVLEGCTSAPGSIGVASRYHRARALERLGRDEEARSELAAVVEQDRSETRWYALWSRQRLSEHVAARTSGASDDDANKGGERPAVRVPLDPGLAARGTPLLSIPNAPAPSTSDDEADLDADDEIAEGTPSRWTPMPRDEIERRLAAMSTTYGEAFPWFARALANVRLGDDLSATQELHEASLAWREARGNAPLRAGVEAVYRGATPPRRSAGSPAIWRARRTLADTDRLALAEISASLGDHGLAVRYGGRGRVASRPRAYEAIVTEVARERGIDPNLLLAVMRVESVYNPRIVSYAGAIGLMQIMPRTGRLIARSMGREADFGIDDLLDPRTNIEFAAWYLSSLIRRFDGRVPLAVASYNGGPHNVRRWMNEHSDTMPLDAFLERIPFTQTHRYVRRVLGHWAAYRAQQGLPMVEIDPTLPELEADHVAF